MRTEYQTRETEREEKHRRLVHWNALLQAVDGHCRAVWDRRSQHLSQEYDRPRNGNAYVSLALQYPGDKIDAAFARLSALLAGCGPPITQDCITTIKSRISLAYPRKALSSAMATRSPGRLDAGTKRWSVMGGWWAAAGYSGTYLPVKQFRFTIEKRRLGGKSDRFLKRGTCP